MTVNVELAHRWIDALESGEYEQAQGYLRKGDAMCCLGVLCDISGTAPWEIEGETCSYLKRSGSLPAEIQCLMDTDHRDDFGEQGPQFMFGDLPESLATEIESQISRLVNRDLTWTAAGLNDSGVKFPTIAKVVRWWLERAA